MILKLKKKLNIYKDNGCWWIGDHMIKTYLIGIPVITAFWYVLFFSVKEILSAIIYYTQ